MSAPSVAAIFDRLDAWRHFPAYQLERRADIFFSFYLPQALTQATGVEVEPQLVPEFPLKKLDSYQSDKVDYLAVSKDGSRVFLVELKTDLASLRISQHDYLLRAQARGLSGLLHDLCAIVGSSSKSARRKYYHLLESLASLGLIELPHDLERFTFAAASQGFTKCLASVVVPAHEAKLDIVYVQPRAIGDRTCISFEQLAAIARSYGDPFSLRFAASLERWAMVGAGERG